MTEVFRFIVPELVLLATMCLFLLWSAFLVPEQGQPAKGLRDRWAIAALAAVALAGWFWWQQSPQASGWGLFRLDALTWVVRGITLAWGGLLLSMAWRLTDDRRAGETQACLLAVLAGIGLTAAANDLVTLFLALELVSISTYILLLYPRPEPLALEATLKYFLLSIFSSALFLFGLSYLYGVTGSTNLVALAQTFSEHEQPFPALLPLALTLVLTGLSFRLTLVPFHWYAPDVMAGTNTVTAALLAVVPKLVGFVALERLLFASSGMMHRFDTSFMPLLTTLALITMIVGNLLALLQDDVRRLLAYSSISHAGYMLVGFITGLTPVGSPNGREALFFYLAVYGITTLGVFAALAVLQRAGENACELEHFAGLSQRHPVVAAFLALLLLSLAGLPPTVGFLAKLQLFLAAWNVGTETAHWLAWGLAATSVISAWYYLKWAGAMYLRPSTRTEQLTAIEGPAMTALTLCAAGVLLLFFLPQLCWQLFQII
ncbi:MAG: NADH-quinone oxidoreductase subunit N [Planctomycetaceae bacterium]|nr:MAG: NADH-quinone oxidoreductase subunit N [Planctomycetaceae bacterium]